MSLEQELVEWANARPDWQRWVLRQLCDGLVVDPKALADALIAGQHPKVQDLTTADVPGGFSGGPTVHLESVSETKDVNALLEGQSLTLAAPTGLTVIYGDNASGKSGYARVIKAGARARHQEAVLSDVFVEAPGSPVAKLTIQENGSPVSIDWPDQVPSALRRVHFYDEACGDAYLGGETELTYRPSALTLLDRLIEVCDGTQDELIRRLQQNAANRGPLPAVPPESGAHGFLEKLSGETPKSAIDKASSCPDDSAEHLARLASEESRLAASDPGREKDRLTKLSSGFKRLADHLELVAENLGTDGLHRLVAERTKASELRAAAAMASANSFEDQPVGGVGTDRWRALWESARAFSEQDAYHGHAFPFVGDGARCVLCHQTLDEAAADRFARFERFMKDQTEQQARGAERQFRVHLEQIRGFETMPAGIATLFGELRPANTELITQSSAWLDGVRQSRSTLLQAIDSDADQIAAPAVPQPPVAALREVSSELEVSANGIDRGEFVSRLAAIRKERAELAGRFSLSEARPAIEGEIGRLKERAAIEAAKQAVDTGPITRKAAELIRTHVTKLVRDRFTRETHQLRLERITLADTGGHKGRLQHRPELLGASSATEVADVFSEGEQTALGLAGYFTEAYFDASKSALVLDDPVTSLDHVRRAKVAGRLAEFATERQIVVFSHDVSFVADLRRAATEAGATFVERGVERTGEGRPGVVVDYLPWKARDVGSRLQDLEQRLAQIERDRGGWSQDQYEEACALWAGRLSQTWERIVNLEIVQQVVERGSAEVRPMMFRVLARITDADNQEFQESYGRCSAWAARHDQDPERNYVPPEPEEMNQELSRVRAWNDRIRGYKQS